MNARQLSSTMYQVTAPEGYTYLLACHRRRINQERNAFWVALAAGLAIGLALLLPGGAL